jgi:hypothetical protein
MTIETLHNVATPDLQLGDIVLAYGMRILLDTPAETFPNPNRETICYSWLGTVLNADEAVTVHRIPRSFLSTDIWVDGTGWTRVQDNRWNVQGNHFARWSVERSA